MTVTVKTFARLADAAAALSSERGARFLAGGTLVMRAVNEADPALETIVRSTDPSFFNMAISSGRVELGGGVTMAVDPRRARTGVSASGRTRRWQSGVTRGGDHRRQPFRDERRFRDGPSCP